MSYRVGQIAPESNLCQECSLETLAQVISQEEILQVLDQQGAFEQRERRRTMTSTITTLMAMSVYAEQSMGEVLETVMHAARQMWPAEQAIVAGKSALSYRRKQLGATPLQELFHRVAQPPSHPPNPWGLCAGLSPDGHRRHGGSGA